ncbi:hypothetical protein MDA_GLEAN10008428 [Myotis davidii]|uniref:Uncharacterized protein n=1 Tax=Myotis davidii TaxID=225400 RepID=L5ME26_MYODS|nr:hypothetical protein MDA_GLEAN10008428 [Myotis davidii]
MADIQSLLVYTPPSAPAPHPPPPPLLPRGGSGSALSAPPQRRVTSSSRGCPPAAPSLPTYHEERLLPPAHKSQVHVTSTGSEHFPGPLLWEPPASLLDLTCSRSENEHSAPVEGKIYSAAASVKPDTWSMKFAIKICGLCGMKLSHVGEKPFSNASSGELLKTA